MDIIIYDFVLTPDYMMNGILKFVLRITEPSGGDASGKHRVSCG
jgi:hypothetical protein